MVDIDDLPPLPAAVGVAGYRVIAEALTNTHVLAAADGIAS